MPLVIQADFIRGQYQGRGPMGSSEKYPSPERLYSALYAAACSLERLEGMDPEKGLTQTDRAIFAWLEGAAPDAILLPEAIVSMTEAITYRKRGDMAEDKKHKSGLYGYAKPGVEVPLGVSLSGPICWYWTNAPQSHLILRLSAIACEVPYLGGSDSPVVITVGVCDAIPQEAHPRVIPSFNALSFRVAAPGHSNELDADYAKRQQEDCGGGVERNKSERISQPVIHYVENAYYAQESSASSTNNAPWTTGYAFRVENRRLCREEYLAVATCMHRALTRKFGDDLPRIMQRVGRQSDAPANGMAIQVIQAEYPKNILDDSTHDYVLLMLPRDTLSGEESRVVQVASQIEYLFSKELGRIQVSFIGERLNLSHFWTPVPEGVHRVFAPEPVFIADNRPPSKKKHDGSRWTVDDDVRIAVGHVWRGVLHFPDMPGDAGRLALARLVDETGVLVWGGHVVPTDSIRRYVHRVPKGALLVASRASVDLEKIGCSECLCAIGQTRHFGGGLLVPTDIPIPVLESEGQPARGGVGQ